MSDRAATSVIVVKYDDEMLSELTRCVLRHRWEVLDGRTTKSLVRCVLSAHPRVLLVQVPAAIDAAVALIEKSCRHWNPVAVVAVASEGGESTELQLRRAGVTAYLGPAASQDGLEQVLKQVAPGCIGTTETEGQVEVKVGKLTKRKTKPRNDAREGMA